MSTRPRSVHVVTTIACALVALASVACRAAAPAPEPTPRVHGPGDASAELSARIDRIDAAIRAEMPAAGATVAVARAGALVAVHAVGVADLEQGVAATADTVYCIGSISKIFTAAAVLQLVEQGRLALDDELTRYLPDFPAGEQPITIHQLLHHESGLPDFEYVGTWPTTKAVRRTAQEVVATFRDLPREFAPGTRWRYSTSGYYLLGLVIEAVTGEPFAAYLQAHVFAPAALTATRFCDADALIPGRARGYTSTPDEDALINAELADLSQYGGGGGLCSTAGDLVRFWIALRAGRLVSPASLSLMQGPHALGDGTPTFYGYGLFTTRFRGQQAIGHSGGVPGFSAQLLHYTDDDLTIAVLGNVDGLHPLELERRLADELMPLEAGTDLAVPATMRDRFIGCYAFDELPGQLEILADGSHLRVRTRAGEVVALRHLGEGVFLMDERQQVSFDGLRADAPATRFVSTAYGMAFAATRTACAAAPSP